MRSDELTLYGRSRGSTNQKPRGDLACRIPASLDECLRSRFCQPGQTNLQCASASAHILEGDLKTSFRRLSSAPLSSLRPRFYVYWLPSTSSFPPYDTALLVFVNTRHSSRDQVTTSQDGGPVSFAGGVRFWWLVSIRIYHFNSDSSTAQTDIKSSAADPSAEDFLAREKAILGDDANQFATVEDAGIGDDDLLGGGESSNVQFESRFESQFPDIAGGPNEVCAIPLLSTSLWLAPR